MHPTADDDFVKLLSTLCKICYAFEEKMNLKISHKLR